MSLGWQRFRDASWINHGPRLMRLGLAALGMLWLGAVGPAALGAAENEGDGKSGGGSGGTSGGDGEVRVVKLEAVGGLQYDRKRFVVKPGDEVRLVLKNVDTMMHNLVITEPGGRLAAVNAAMRMGKDGPDKGYIPDADEVLHGIGVLGPGQTEAIEFTAPENEGVYPYVCTFPGHGFIMYGAMYVTTDRDALPELAEDPHVPDPDAAASAMGEGAAGTGVRVTRTFLPAAGPAAVAVGLPGGQSYCFDAGACYLRYAWRGGFIDDTVLMESKGDHFAKIKGRVYYRRRGGFPLRIGSNPEGPAQRREYLGYEIDEGAVTFRYRVDGVTVRERIEARGEKGSGVAGSGVAGSGLVRKFELGATGDRPVWFLTEQAAAVGVGVEFSSSAGSWNDGRLRLTAEEANSFTITMKERPGVEPIGYWSMNDELWKGSALPVLGVVGRALKFDGKNDEIATGITTEQLQKGATLSVWMRVPKAKGGKQTVIGAKTEGEDQLGLRYSKKDGYNWHFSAELEPGLRTTERLPLNFKRPSEWHHFAVVVTDEREMIYLDGRLASDDKDPYASMLPAGELYIGSEGGKRHFKGQLDEVRIYDRALSGDAVRALIEEDKRRPSRMHVVQPISE